MKIGILGGGQLARMMALAGTPLGLRFACYDPTADCCAASVSQHFMGDYDDKALLARFADDVDIITYEFENVPAETARFLNTLMLQKDSGVFPGEKALYVTQDRLREKQMFQSLSIATPGFMAIDSAVDLERAAKELGLPMVLKSRSGGYDGKGQQVIRSAEELQAVTQNLKAGQLIAEAWIPFSREVSIIAARSRIGETVFYDLAENVHHKGILATSHNRANDPMQAQAEAAITRLLDALDYVGVLALEFFEKDGALLANEYAPRVHNTGHWTIEGACCSQFENHLRAIIGWPLGSGASKGDAAMINFIGKLPAIKPYLETPRAYYHDYGKQARPGRKVGHATLVGDATLKLDTFVAELN